MGLRGVIDIFDLAYPVTLCVIHIILTPCVEILWWEAGNVEAVPVSPQ